MPAIAAVVEPVATSDIDEAAFQDLFAELDTDGNGFIDKEELQKGLRKLGVHPRKMLEKNYADV